MRRAVFFSVLGAATATFLLGGTYALATNFTFVLGSTANQPDALTAVTAKNVDGHGGLNGPMIRLTNNSTAPNATALALGTNKNKTPFTTSSGVKVTNLNADKLDGIDSTGFVKGTGFQLLTGHAELPPEDPPTFEVVYSHPSAPAFNIEYVCPSDLSTDGGIYLRNTSSSSTDVVSSLITASDSVGLRYGPGQIDGWETARARGAEATFTASWFDGHFARITVTSFHRLNQPDPRDDACDVQTMVLVR